jgi:WD40 repeat protein
MSIKKKTQEQATGSGGETELPPGVKLLRSLEGHQDMVRSVAFDPQGETLASGSEDKSVKLWETRSGKLLRTLEGHQNAVMSVSRLSRTHQSQASSGRRWQAGGGWRRLHG